MSTFTCSFPFVPLSAGVAFLSNVTLTFMAPSLVASTTFSVGPLSGRPVPGGPFSGGGFPGGPLPGGPLAGGLTGLSY